MHETASQWNKLEVTAALGKEKAELIEKLGHLGVKDGTHWDPTTSDLKEEAGERSAVEPDSGDAAMHIEELEERSAETATLEIRLAEIEKAFGALADGSYGTCTVDGAPHPIEIGRLHATGWTATTCLSHHHE